MQGNDGQPLADPVPAVLAPGNYDGIHRGHQVLLERAKAHARAHGLQTRVLTFDPHPVALLAPDRAPTPLTTPERKRELLLGHGIDAVEIAHFDAEYAAQTPETFVDRLVAKGAKAFVVGHDFRFGKRAAGDVAMLRELGQTRDFVVMEEDPVRWHGERVSSSAVRAALEAGAVDHAGDLQARYHDLSGVVVPGDRRGRTLGFPTLNLAADPVLWPGDGVYAVMVRLLGTAEDGGGQTDALQLGVANLGTRPTFEAGRSLEVHLLDFSGDLYDQRVRVAFVSRLRGEQAFDGVDALKAQIARDCAAARQALSNADQGKLAWI